MLYSALKDEFKNDIELSSHLEISKDDLHNSEIITHHPLHHIIITTFIAAFNFSDINGRISSEEILFLGLTASRALLPMNFWNSGLCHRQGDIENCDPLHWWYGCRAQYSEFISPCSRYILNSRFVIYYYISMQYLI